MKHTLKVYKNSELHAEYSRVRFSNKSDSSGSFELNGHRWKYEFTSFDDIGDYDLLYRFTDEPEPEPEPDLTELRDVFAGMAMQSIPLALDINEQNLIANAAYRMADAMIKARNQ